MNSAYSLIVDGLLFSNPSDYHHLFDEFSSAIVHFLVFMGIYNDQLDSICRFALCVIQLPWLRANNDRDVHGSRIGAFSATCNLA